METQYPATAQNDCILRRREVLKRLGLSNSAFYARIKRGEIKPGFSLGAQAVGWLSSYIDKWINDRATAGRKAS
ncbi:MAG: AlpA family phage regulatory protein [Proteobacteria bacterium]|nr:AlpA family phage regulatory protein [Pseudomonadota bacterium]